MYRNPQSENICLTLCKTQRWIGHSACRGSSQWAASSWQQKASRAKTQKLYQSCWGHMPSAFKWQQSSPIASICPTASLRALPEAMSELTAAHRLDFSLSFYNFWAHPWQPPPTKYSIERASSLSPRQKYFCCCCKSKYMQVCCMKDREEVSTEKSEQVHVILCTVLYITSHAREWAGKWLGIPQLLCSMPMIFCYSCSSLDHVSECFLSLLWGSLNANSWNLSDSMISCYSFSFSIFLPKLSYYRSVSDSNTFCEALKYLLDR